MSSSLFKSILLVHLIGIFILLTSACSGEPIEKDCVNEISQALDIDPQGSACKSKCECNNQRYEGDCISGRCQSKKRESCLKEGEKRVCVTDNQSSKGCSTGLQICKDQGLKNNYWGDCKSVAPTKDEKGKDLCADGIDNDCDGKVDHADPDCGTFCQPGKTEPCYTGPKDTQNVGICKTGTRTCSDTGTWGSCQKDIKPGTEKCNSLDDDCDGKVDEDIPGCERCQDGETRRCYTGDTKKECVPQKNGTFKCQGSCQAGIQKCEGGIFTRCKGEILPEKETCNNKDDDCDGTVDEGADKKPLQTICYSGTTGCRREGDQYQCDGVCKSGLKSCSKGQWGKCVGAVIPTKEACDGQKDENCDGTVDEGCGCTPNGKTQPCGNNKGICKQGKQTCTSGKWGTCVGAVGGKSETCNGLDDDCNGKVDDNLQSRPKCEKQLGVCTGSIKPASRCVGGKWSACTDADYTAYGTTQKKLYATSDSTCDTLDNDCDGKTDEDASQCITTFAGKCQVSGNVIGAWNAARFNNPRGLTADAAGNIYVADTDNHCIRRIDKNGTVSTFAGRCGVKGYKGGARTSALFYRPVAILYSTAKSAFYIADQGNFRIRSISKTGIVATAAGNGKISRTFTPGPYNTTAIGAPEGVAEGPTGSIFITARGQNVGFGNVQQWVLKLYFNVLKRKHYLALASGGSYGYTNGKGTSSRYKAVKGIVYINNAALKKQFHYVADRDNYRIRNVKSVIPYDTGSFAGTGKKGHVDDTAGQSEFTAPTAICSNKAAALYLTDGNRIRKISFGFMAASKTTTLAGEARPGFANGSALYTKFNGPEGILYLNGLVYIADTRNHCIRRYKK